KIINAINKPFPLNDNHRISTYGLSGEHGHGAEEAIASNPASSQAAPNQAVSNQPAASQTDQPPIVHVTVSVGIAFYPNDAATPDQLIAAADYAMLSAKSKGKNNCQYYETLKPVDLEHSRHRLDVAPLKQETQDTLETSDRKIPTA
ncbi:MAG: diguanylate cyclase domain-containing protein, partial [Cyanophyceae cyanobacterium]